MKINVLISLLILLMAAPSSWSCTPDTKEGLVPDNDLYIPVDAKQNKDQEITKEVYDRVLDEINEVYEPIVRSHGGKLNIMRLWHDGTVNAMAHRRGGTWNIVMYGGLARHDTITPDGLALAACHEIGHHIGGAPKKYSFFANWITNEGQADYFATLKCLRKVWRSQDNERIVEKLTVPELVIDQCTKQFNQKEDRLLCQRGAMAGLSVAKLFQALRRQAESPEFNRPDSARVPRTVDHHPATQCRLDTYYAGALCDVLDADDVDQSDEKVGVCNRRDSRQIGARPFCWFAPKA